VFPHRVSERRPFHVNQFRCAIVCAVFHVNQTEVRGADKLMVGLLFCSPVWRRIATRRTTALRLSWRMIDASHFARFYVWSTGRLFPAATRQALSQPVPSSFTAAWRWYAVCVIAVAIIDLVFFSGRFFFGTEKRAAVTLFGICALGLVLAMWRSRKEHLAHEAMLAAERARDEEESSNASSRSQL
jgi:hypothetical protein